MLKKMLIAVAMSAVAVSAFANNYAQRTATQVIDLKDGSKAYVLNDGKMAMESLYGRAVRTAPGMTMEAKGGKKVAMVGDEVASRRVAETGLSTQHPSLTQKGASRQAWAATGPPLLLVLPNVKHRGKPCVCRIRIGNAAPFIAQRPNCQRVSRS